MSVVEQLNELRDKVHLEKLIENNTYEFEIEEKVFRVRLPNKKEIAECEEERAKKLIEMLQKPDTYKSREQWIALYKNMGIDIKAKEEKIKAMGEDIKRLYGDIAPAEDENLKKRLAEEVEELGKKIEELGEEIKEKLKYSIEDVLNEYGNDSLMIKVLEKQNELVWERVYKSREELEKYEDSLMISVAKNAFDYLIQHAQL